MQDREKEMYLTPTLTKLGPSTTTTYSVKDKSLDLVLKGTLAPERGHSGLHPSELLDLCNVMVMAMVKATVNTLICQAGSDPQHKVVSCFYLCSPLLV